MRALDKHKADIAMNALVKNDREQLLSICHGPGVLLNTQVYYFNLLLKAFMLGAIGAPSLICNFKFQKALKIRVLWGEEFGTPTHLGSRLDLK